MFESNQNSEWMQFTESNLVAEWQVFGVTALGDDGVGDHLAIGIRDGDDETHLFVMPPKIAAKLALDVLATFFDD